MIKISIVTVVLNAVETIKRTLDSVIDQDFQNFEYIIIDGGSTDGTINKLYPYKQYFSYFISEKDNGIYDAMNKGLFHATGDVVAFLNGDDWYEPNALQLAAGYFEENPDIDIVFGLANMFANGEYVGKFSTNMKEFYRQMPGCHQALFAKKALFDQYGGFDISYRITSDFDWFMRIYFSGARILTVEDTFVNYNLGGLSGVQAKEARIEDHKIALKHIHKNKREDLYNVIETVYLNNMRFYNAAEAEEYARVKDTLDLHTDFFHDSKYLLLWGTGKIGSELLNVFSKASIKIDGFIDTNRKGKEFFGYHVFLPEEAPQDSCICIASIKYQDEIMRDITGTGIDINKVITYDDIVDLILDCKARDTEA